MRKLDGFGEEERAAQVAADIEEGEPLELSLDVLIDLQDLVVGDGLIGLLREALRAEARLDARQACAEAIVVEEKAMAAGQGALFETAPEGFEPK